MLLLVCRPFQTLQPSLTESNGPPLTASVFAGLLQFHEVCFIPEDEFGKLCVPIANEISGEVFADAMNKLISGYVKDMAKVIGAENCEQIFGTKPGERAEIVDPETARNSD